MPVSVIGVTCPCSTTVHYHASVSFSGPMFLLYEFVSVHLMAQNLPGRPGDELRKIFAELEQISLVDIVLPTRTGISIRKRCVSRPTEHQAILLQRLGLGLPTCIECADL